MHRVGAALLQKAMAAHAADEADVFGRSAFNRYYYATYLITRKMLQQLNPSWSGTAHKNIPSLLTQTVVRHVRETSRSQERQGLIKDAGSLCRWVAQNASSLADMMKEAYEVRCIADYEPETQIQRSGKVIKLADHSTHEAENWPGRASLYAGAIVKTWRQLGLG